MTQPEPTNADLRRARFIHLTTEPKTYNAYTLTSAIISVSAQHSSRQRKVGKKGLPKQADDLGAILGGLLRPGLAGDVVSVSRSSSGWMWNRSNSAMIGHGVFWRHVGALEAAGLVGVIVGEQFSSEDNSELGGDIRFSGTPTKIWLTQAMIEMAQQHGVTEGTARQDFRVSRKAEATRPPREPSQGVIVGPPRWLFDQPRAGRKEPYNVALTTEDQRLRDRLVADVEEQNAFLRRADIHGCVAPVLYRSFAGGLDLGGRFYTPGCQGYCQMPKEDRREITINGKATIEIDIRSAFLTVFLGLTGRTKLPEGDLYDLRLPDVPRDAIKAFFTQSFGQGHLAKQWGKSIAWSIQAFP